MKDFLKSSILQSTVSIIEEMYRAGWDERNGGNLSYLLYHEEVEDYINPEKGRDIHLNFHVPELAGKYLLVTGAGKFFRNVAKDPPDNLGLVKVSEDGKSIRTVWGYTGGGSPTSEISAHLRGHISRLRQDKQHRIVMHSHPANIIALSYIIPQDEKILSYSLWQMISECIVLFPEGVGIVPWMPPGTDELGIATAEKMQDFRLVFWPQHGIFSTGAGLDDAFGLLEAVEKAAEIYIKVHSCVGAPRPNITTAQLKEVGRLYHLPIRKDFLPE